MVYEPFAFFGLAGLAFWATLVICAGTLAVRWDRFVFGWMFFTLIYPLSILVLLCCGQRTRKTSEPSPDELAAVQIDQRARMTGGV